MFYHWQTSRSAECLAEFMPPDFKGTLQSDGYTAYGKFARSRGVSIELAGCWAHVRRKFYEAKAQSPQIAGFILRQIQLLYRVEKKLRHSKAGPRLREACRAAESKWIYQRIGALLRKLQEKARYLPSSSMGKAIQYAASNWTQLEVYLKDGRVEIDNNLVENAIRPTALGKKNWMFFGEAKAGERSAILYTVIENCRRLDIDPYEYLRDILSRLPSMTNWQVKDLVPRNWLKARRAKSLAQAA